MPEAIGHLNNSRERASSSIEDVAEYLETAQSAINAELSKLSETVPEEERVMVSSDLRIIPPGGIYKDLHRQKMESYFEDVHGSTNEATIQKAEQQVNGFQFEMLNTAIMHKNLGDRFLVVRSSRFDDVFQGIDTVIIDKKTGEAVCAIDEVTSEKFSQDPRFLEKKKKILGRNFGISILNEEGSGMKSNVIAERGAKLEYGIKLENGIVRCAPMEQLPIFLMSIDPAHLRKGIAEFDPNGPSVGYEKQLFTYLISALGMQIQELKLDPHGYSNLPEDLRARVENFEKFIKTVSV